MPWLPLYADEQDLSGVLAWLNAEKDVAFLIPSGSKRWVAVEQISSWLKPRMALWHVPSGPLPLLGPDRTDPPGEVPDPWASWKELRSGADPSTPYFGPGHPGIVWFNHRADQKTIGIPSFEWVGNWYKLIGTAAHTDTEKWWRRLGRRMRRDAVRIPRRGPIDGPNPEIWAMPGAYSLIRSGVPRGADP